MHIYIYTHTHIFLSFYLSLSLSPSLSLSRSGFLFENINWIYTRIHMYIINTYIYIHIYIYISTYCTSPSMSACIQIDTRVYVKMRVSADGSLTHARVAAGVGNATRRSDQRGSQMRPNGSLQRLWLRDLLRSRLTVGRCLQIRAHSMEVNGSGSSASGFGMGFRVLGLWRFRRAGGAPAPWKSGQ